MRYLLLTVFFLVSFVVIACGQIVFPSPNQVKIQKGNLNIGKNVSIYAEDTTTFYLSFFRTEVLRNIPVKWTKKASKAEIYWVTDSSLSSEAYKISINPRQMVIAASGKEGFTHAVQTLRQWVADSAGNLIFASVVISDSPPCAMALFSAGFRTAIPENSHYQKIH